MHHTVKLTFSAEPRHFATQLKTSIVEPLLTHTPRWTPKGMRYEGLCVRRGILKIDLVKKIGKFIIATLWCEDKLD
jgi:hypothetical protein